MGSEKGINAIVPYLLDFIIQQSYERYSGEVESWCAFHGGILSEGLVEGLQHENSKARLFTVKCLARIGNKDYYKAVSTLNNDPDSGVCSAVRDALKMLN